MRRHLLLGCALIVALLLTIANVVTRWHGETHDARSDFSTQFPLGTPLIKIEANGRAEGLNVAEESIERILAETGTPLALRVTGRVAPLDENRNAIASQRKIGSGFRHDWPAVYASARFNGSRLLIAFADEFNRYRMSFDDAEGPIIVVNRPERRAFLVSGLGPGEHEVRVEKISESAGTGGLLGLYVPTDGEPLSPPQPLARQIEFIGDSDSVGYGNLSTTRDCAPEETFELTDTQRSFGPQIARHFGADYQLVAASGIGVLRNYGGSDPDRTMPTLYPLRLRGGQEPYVSSDWKPQIVVLALGSNDLESPLAPDEPWTDRRTLREAFVAKYSQFLRDVRARNEMASLILVMWPQYGSDYVQAHEAVLQTIRAAGDIRIDLIALPKMARTGCDWHPNLNDHQEAFNEITRYIELHPDMWESR